MLRAVPRARRRAECAARADKARRGYPLAGPFAFRGPLDLLCRLVRSVGGIAARFFLASPCAFSCAGAGFGRAACAGRIRCTRPARLGTRRKARARARVRGAADPSASFGETFALKAALRAPPCDGYRRDCGVALCAGPCAFSKNLALRARSSSSLARSCGTCEAMEPIGHHLLARF